MPEKFLSIICNSVSLLTELELTHWNELCGRNCLFKEKFKSGIYVSDFDIKTEQRLYNAKMSKLDYIEKLGEENSKKVTRTDIQLNLHGLKKQSFYNPLTLIDRVKVQPLNVNDPNQIVGYAFWII